MWLSPEIRPYFIARSSGSISCYDRVPQPITSRSLALLELFDQLRDDLEDVADDAEVGHLEDRRVGISVDGDDRLRALHAGQVLDRAGDPARDVEIGLHGLAGLADLERVGHPRGVDRGARRADGAAQELRQLLQHREPLRPFEAASARDDDPSVLELRALALHRHALQYADLSKRRIARDFHPFDHGGHRLWLDLERLRPHPASLRP